MTVPLRVRRPGSIGLDRAVLALSDLSWLGRPTDGPPDHPKLRQVATDLDLPILDGSSTGPVRKAAFIDIGPVRQVGDRVLVEIAWRSASLAPLFPVFAGELSISANDIVLDGRYAPPLGTLGLLIDQASCTSLPAAPRSRSSHASPRSSSRRQARRISLQAPSTPGRAAQDWEERERSAGWRHGHVRGRTGRAQHAGSAGRSRSASGDRPLGGADVPVERRAPPALRTSGRSETPGGS